MDWVRPLTMTAMAFCRAEMTLAGTPRWDRSFQSMASCSTRSMALGGSTPVRV